MAAALHDFCAPDFPCSLLRLREDSQGKATARVTLSTIIQLQTGQSTLFGLTGRRLAFAIEILLIEADGQEVTLPLAGCCIVKLYLYRAIGVERHLHMRHLA